MIIGVTDHFRAPFHIEAKALGADVEFVDFHSRNEADFDSVQLRRLDALLVWHARIGARTVDHLDNCKIVVRYGVGYDNIDLDAFKALLGEKEYQTRFGKSETHSCGSTAKCGASMKILNWWPGRAPVSSSLPTSRPRRVCSSSIPRRRRCPA